MLNQLKDILKMIVVDRFPSAAVIVFYRHQSSCENICLHVMQSKLKTDNP